MVLLVCLFFSPTQVELRWSIGLKKKNLFAQCLEHAQHVAGGQ